LKTKSFSDENKAKLICKVSALYTAAMCEEKEFDFSAYGQTLTSSDIERIKELEKYPQLLVKAYEKYPDFAEESRRELLNELTDKQRKKFDEIQSQRVNHR